MNDDEKITITELIELFKLGGLDIGMLLPFAFRTKSQDTRVIDNRSKAPRKGLIRRGGRVVEDAKFSPEFWNKDDCFIYLKRGDAESLLTSEVVPKYLKKIIMFNLDKYSGSGRVALDITQMIRYNNVYISEGKSADEK